jgi:hypothetical protein
MLDAWAGRTTYAANPAVYVQLHTGAPGAAGTANVAAETTRKAVTFGTAASAGAISSTAACEWPSLATGETLSHVSYWTASSGGTFLGDEALNTTAVMLAGQTFRIGVGGINVQLSGDIAVAERNKMLDAWAGRAGYTANAAVYVQLHTGAPGAAGTSNVAAETTRKLVTYGTAASAGSIANTAIVEWTPYPNGTDVLSHVSQWTAAAAGTVLGTDDLPSSTTMSLGDAARIAIGALTAALS